MSRTLLIGPAGSGKTHRILGEFEKILTTDPHPLSDRTFFLVPSAEHTGRIVSVLMARGVEGFFHRRVTTLARLISGTFGIGDEGVATNMTRYVLLRSIFEKENWECFKEIQQSAGFLNHMLSFIAELKESMLPVSVWRDKMNEMKRLEPGLAAKYEALAGIYEAYENGLQQKGLRDRQDGFHIFQERKKAGAFKGRRFQTLWLDGFFDFSALQLAYFQELCDMTDQVTVTLTYDEDPKRAALFEGLRPTFEVLKELGFKTEILAPKKNFRFVSAELSAVEKNLFREAKPAPLPNAGEDKSIVLFEAIGIEGEIEMIARRIEKMHRAGDYRFSDFAILLRDIGVYDSVIRSVFARYDIPVEIHERERLGFSPMMRVIVRLLKIFRDGWKRSDLFEFLKSTYVTRIGDESKHYEQIAGLEHRAIEKGVFRGRDAWLEIGEGLGLLAALEDSLRAAKTFPAFRSALVRGIKSFGIFRIHDSDLEGHIRRDAATWKRFESILDETGLSFVKGDELSLDVFADRFFRLVDLDLYPLHEQDRNRVQVYSISLARQKEYRVVFVAGMLEKKFPVQMKEDPVLSDWERQLFNGLQKGAGGELKERLPRQSMERYLFYLAVTRASENLFLTYPRLDLEGKESLPSYYIEEVLPPSKRLERTKKQSLGRPYPEVEEAVSGRELEMAVMGELWAPEKDLEKRPLLLYLTSELLKNPAAEAKFKRAFYEVKDQLTDPKIAALDPFSAFLTSATKLEEYALCPFKYYSRQVLKLADPEDDMNIKRRGIILHLALQKCFEKWKGKYPSWTTAAKHAEAALEEAFREGPLVKEKQYQLDLEYESLRAILLDFLKDELQRLAASPFQPHPEFELSFGREGSRFPPLEIEGEAGKVIRLTGSIDRIDANAVDAVGEIVDYKRTEAAAKADREDFDRGLSLQMPLYLLAMEKFLGFKPAGAEFFILKKKDGKIVRKGFYHADYLQYFGGREKKKMIFSGKEFRDLLDRSLDFVRSYSRAMTAMEIPVLPHKENACDFCSYRTVCRIQKWRVPLLIEEMKKKECCNETH